MNIRQLEAFRATMVAGTVSGAAGLMALSQPAVSRLLDQLEHRLNLTLFDRSKVRLIPTPEAHLLFEEVERTFRSVDKIREIAAEIRAARAGHLQLAALPALALGFLPDVVARFRAAHPKAALSLAIQTSAKIEEWAAAQRIELGLAEFPFQRPGVEVEEFCATALVLLVPRGHHLAGRAEGVSVEELQDETFVSLTRHTVGRLLTDRIFERADVQRVMLLEAQYAAAIAGMVERGLGVGLVDPFTAHEFERRGGVIALPFRPAVLFRVGLLYPAHRPLSRMAREFLTVLRTYRTEVLGRWAPEAFSAEVNRVPADSDPVAVT